MGVSWPDNNCLTLVETHLHTHTLKVIVHRLIVKSATFEVNQFFKYLYDCLLPPSVLLFSFTKVVVGGTVYIKC